jgi:hypothetical protein
MHLMQLPEFTRSTTLRWTALVAAIFAAFIVAMLGFVYLKTKDDLTQRSDRIIAAQIGAVAQLSPERRLDAIDEHLKQDPGRVRLAGLFASNGRRITGNLENRPPDLRTDDTVQGALVDRTDATGREKQEARLIARSLPNGDVLVIGRNVDEVGEIARVVGATLALGLLCTVLLCLAVGVALGARSRRRIVEVNERVGRIVAGNLRERLPHQNADDPFSKLAIIVNGMLDEMETLIQSLAGVGNDIAHDLRTPLYPCAADPGARPRRRQDAGAAAGGCRQSDRGNRPVAGDRHGHPAACGNREKSAFGWLRQGRADGYRPRSRGHVRADSGRQRHCPSGSFAARTERVW